MAASTRNRASRTPFQVPDEPGMDAVLISQNFESDNPEHWTELVTLDIDDLHIDPLIQRGEEPGEISAIVADFNAAAVGTLIASYRAKTGLRSLLDGQQRRAAIAICRELGKSDGKVAVLLHHGLSIEEEARLFLQLNNRRSVGAMQQFKARLTSGEKQALAIKAILDDLEIPFGKPPKGFMAIRRADDIFRQEGGAVRLRWALTMIRDIFDEDGKGGCYDGRVMVAFALIHKHFVPGKLDEQLMKKKLMSTTSLVNKLIGMGTTRKEINGGDISYNIAMAIVQIYNGRKRGFAATSTKLPDIPRQRSARVMDENEAGAEA